MWSRLHDFQKCRIIERFRQHDLLSRSCFQFELQNEVGTGQHFTVLRPDVWSSNCACSQKYTEKITFGVPQGTILDPLLFFIYMTIHPDYLQF